MVRTATFKSHAMTAAVKIAIPIVNKSHCLPSDVLASGSPSMARHAKRHHMECHDAETSHTNASSRNRGLEYLEVSRYNSGCARDVAGETSWSKHANATVGRDVHSTLNVAIAAVVKTGCALIALTHPNHTLAMAYTKFL